MSWPTPSLFTKVTRAPRATTMSFGDTPAEVIVIVVVPPAGGGVGGGGGFGDGDGAGVGSFGESPPPQATTASDEPMVRVRAARLAAQMRARHVEHLRESRQWKNHSLPRGRLRGCRASGAALLTRRGPLREV